MYTIRILIFNLLVFSTLCASAGSLVSIKTYVLNEGVFGGKGSIGYWELVYYTGEPGTPAFTNTYTHIDSIPAFGNQILHDDVKNALYVTDGAGNLLVYSTNSLSLIHSLAIGARSVAISGSQLLVACTEAPYFRVYDRYTYNFIYSLDSSKVSSARENIAVGNGYAFLSGYNADTTLWIVDLAAQDTFSHLTTAFNNNGAYFVPDFGCIVFCPDYLNNITYIHHIYADDTLLNIDVTDTLIGNSYYPNLNVNPYPYDVAHITMKGFGEDAFNYYWETRDTLQIPGTSTYYQVADFTSKYIISTSDFQLLYSETDYFSSGSIGFTTNYFSDTLVFTNTPDISPRSFAISDYWVGYTESREASGLSSFYQLAPNPAKHLSILSQTEGKRFEASLCNLQGQVLAQYQGQGQLRIDTENLPAGLYFVNILEDGQRASLKLQVVK